MKKPKEPKPPKIAKEMRDHNETLHLSFGPEGGRRYWLEPSSREVTEGAALRAQSWPEVKSLRDGIFPDETPQSWAWQGQR